MKNLLTDKLAIVQPIGTLIGAILGLFIGIVIVKKTSYEELSNDFKPAP